MGVYAKVDRSEVKQRQGEIISTKWIDTHKGTKDSPTYRSRLAGRDIKKDKIVRNDLYAATPPLEVIKLLIAKCATGQRSNRPLRIATVDVRRAYFYARVQRPIDVEIPAEDWKPGDEGKIAKLEMSLYGARDAATNWARAVEEALIGIGFKRGIASTCSYQHRARHVDLTVHGDDFIILGAAEDLTWAVRGIEKCFDIKTEMLGPEPGMKQEVGFLNRQIAWATDGITYESDSQHVNICLLYTSPSPRDSR